MRFAKELKKQLMKHYKDKAIVEISDILKTNGKKEVGLSIIFTEAEDIAVPVIYIEGMYEHYKNNDYTMDDCVRQITELRDKLVYEECFEDKTMLDYCGGEVTTEKE